MIASYGPGTNPQGEGMLMNSRFPPNHGCAAGVTTSIVGAAIE
jgi:hypothetical protein